MLDHQFIWDNRNKLLFVEVQKILNKDNQSYRAKIGLLSQDLGFIDLTQSIATVTKRNFYKDTGTINILPSKTNANVLITDYLSYVKTKLNSTDRIGLINIHSI